MARNPFTRQIRPTARPLGQAREPIRLRIGVADGKPVLIFSMGRNEHRCAIDPAEALKMASALTSAAYQADPSLFQVESPLSDPSIDDELLAESYARTPLP